MKAHVHVIITMACLALMACGTVGDDDSDPIMPVAPGGNGNDDADGAGAGGGTPGDGTDSTMDPAQPGGADAGSGGGTGDDGTGSDTGDDDADKDGDTETDPECDRDALRQQVANLPEGEPSRLTQQELSNCANMCPMDDEQCLDGLESECPGWNAFDLCFSEELFRCTAGDGGGCQDVFLDYACCSEASECEPEDTGCVEQACGTELDAWRTCAQEDEACGQTSVTNCVGDGSEPYPECPRDEIQDPPAADGPTDWTSEDLQACGEMCDQDDDACFEELGEDDCPGLEAFNECYGAALMPCTASVGGRCRADYEDLLCCGSANQCGDDSACIENNCDAELTEFRECSGGDRMCQQEARDSCLSAQNRLSRSGAGAAEGALPPALLPSVGLQVRQSVPREHLPSLRFAVPPLAR